MKKKIVAVAIVMTIAIGIKVKASEILNTKYIETPYQISTDSGSTWTNMNRGGDGFYYNTINLPNTGKTIYTQFNQKMDMGNSDYLYYTIHMYDLLGEEYTETTSGTSTGSNYICDEVSHTANGITDSYWSCTTTGSGNNNSSTSGNITTHSFTVSLAYWYGDNVYLYTSCLPYVLNNNSFTFRCPSNKGKFNGFRVGLSSNANITARTTFDLFYTTGTDSTTQAIENMTNQTIENQNQNTQQQIDSQKVCTTKQTNSTDILDSGKELSSSGNIGTSSVCGITDYIQINNESQIKILEEYKNSTRYSCFYTEGKSVISCLNIKNYNTGDYIDIPSNAYYFRATIIMSINRPQFEIKTCKNGNQALQDTLNEDHEYENNGEELNGTQELDDYTQAEDQLMNQLDFSGIQDLNITIEEGTSSFIWSIVDRIRAISDKIVLLMTSVLGLGIIKMILNR